MRRLLIFAALLSLLGLSTAFAASFTVQSEDIASFTTDVSISIPEVVDSYFLRGQDSTIPGWLDPNPDPEGSGDPVRTKSLDLGTDDVQGQTDILRYHSWETLPLAAGGLTLNGPASLLIFQNGNTDRLTAQLFDCAPAATPDSTACTPISASSSNPGNEGGGYVLRSVDFGDVAATIPENHRLRVQIVNRSSISTSKWSVQWGLKSNRPSRLDLTVSP